MKLVKEAGLFLAFTSKDIYCKDKLQDNLERLRCYKITKVEEKGVAIFQMPMINVPFRLIYAYNPYANPDMTNPRVPSFERRTDVLGRGSRDSFL